VTSNSKAADGLLARAREVEAAAIAFLQDLVRIPSVNGRDPETPVARRVAEEAERLGLEARLIGADQDRQNIVVEVGVGRPGFALIAHLDTVAEGDPQFWTHPPFGAEIIAGKLFGRGAADNKAGAACSLYALALLKEHGLLDPDSYRAVFAGVVDEESGASSPLGVRLLLDQGALHVDAAIYTYAGDVICIGHRGLLRLTLRAVGQAVHSGSGEWDRGESGVNAATGLAEALVELERLEIEGARHPAFEGLSNKVTPGTTLRGGDGQGMVPAWAEASVDVRLLPGVSPDRVLTQIDEVIRRVEAKRPGLGLQREVRVSLPAAAIPVEHRLVTLAQRVTREITGKAWPAAGAGPANEGYMLIEAGIPTLCGFGPRGENPHAPDEWVGLSSIAPTIAMFAAMIRDYTEEMA
jgi:acetylornithine deacetylase/succinyl-diaminopimelate desuccinylase-like protein